MYPYLPSISAMALSLPSKFTIGPLQIQYYTYSRRASLQYFKITPSHWVSNFSLPKMLSLRSCALFQNARTPCFHIVAHIFETGSSAPHQLLYRAALVVSLCELGALTEHMSNRFLFLFAHPTRGDSLFL